MFHLVERRVRRDLHVPLEFHDRHLSLAILHGSIRKYGLYLCGYNILSDRVLLVVIPSQPRAIGTALMNADCCFVRRFNEIHHRVSPFWQQGYYSCSFAGEVAWRVLRYVDTASLRNGGDDPFGPQSLCSAAEHAGLLPRSHLTAPSARLPRSEEWRAFLETPEDEDFVQALELCLRTGKPFGPFPFVRRVEEACGRRVRPSCLAWPGLFDSVRWKSSVEPGPTAVVPAPACASQAAY
jgi:hypothetical protein